MVNCVDPDQMTRYAESALGLHNLLRTHACLTWGKYDIITILTVKFKQGFNDHLVMSEKWTEEQTVQTLNQLLIL